jgi:hypothetical protein
VIELAFFLAFNASLFSLAISFFFKSSNFLGGVSGVQLMMGLELPLFYNSRKTGCGAFEIFTDKF